MKHLILIILCLSLFACKKTETVVEKQGPQPTEEETIDINQYEGFPDIQVEKLIRSAEKLMHPAGYVYALEILDEVLKREPKNKRALLYKAIIQPFTYFKGVYSRLLPFVKEKMPHRYEETYAHANRHPEGGLRDFLYAEGTPFQNEEEISDYLNGFVEHLEVSRQFFKANKNIVTTIRMNSITKDSYYNNCTVKKLNEGVYHAPQCDGLVSKRMDVNRADMELLQVFTAGMQIYMTLASGYSMEGAIQVEAHDFNHGFETDLERLNYMKSLGTLGKLKNNNLFKSIRKLGADIVTSFKWAKKLERHLCDFGRGNKKNRPGAFFSKGYCLTELTGESSYNSPDLILAMLDLSVQGKDPGQIEVNVNNHPNAHGHVNEDPRYRKEYTYSQWGYGSWNYLKKTTVDPFKPFDNMPEEAWSFIPDYNECGWPKDIADPTFRGLFPEGDGLEIISAGRSEGLEDCDPFRYYTSIAEPRVKEAVIFGYFLSTFEGRMIEGRDYVKQSNSVYRFRTVPLEPGQELLPMPNADANAQDPVPAEAWPQLDGTNSVIVNLNEIINVVEGRWVENFEPYERISWGQSVINVHPQNGMWPFENADRYHYSWKYYDLNKVLVSSSYINSSNMYEFEQWIRDNLSNYEMGTATAPMRFEEVPKQW